MIGLHRLLLSAPGDRPLAPGVRHEQFRARALHVAGGLRARGVGCVALHLEDALDLATGLFGAWRAGVAVILPADLQPATRQRLAGRIDLWLTDQPGDCPPDALAGAPLTAAALEPQACRLLLSTSGSSGDAKLIDKTLGQLACEVEALERLWGPRLGDATLLGSVASQHIYGLLFRVLWPLAAGRTLLPRALPFAEDLQQASLALAGDFAWVASPALLKRLGDNLDWPALRRVRQVFSSGGALPADAATAVAERLGQWPTEIYGSSETGGIAWRQGGTLWQPFEGVELSQSEDGALRIASPYLPRGHVEQSADAARLQPDGRFELLGRLDRLVKLEEKRISLPMLEQALQRHPFVDDARLGVVQQGRAYLGGLVALSAAGLHALRNGGRKALTDALRAHLADHCEALALPRRWRLLEQLPLNAQGKLPQAEVERLLQRPRTRAPELLEAREADGVWTLSLAVPPDLAHFTGHFPRTPVLPGVVQIDWALDLARARLALPPRFAGLEVLKFQQLARPGDRLELTLRFDAERGKLHFAYRNGEAPCSSGRILLEPADA
jgi:acyl-CoA synthetase (AMP-forming)/AMP-acid ligase II